MIKGKIAGSLLVASVLSVPAPVYASHGEPMYYYYYYTDATLTTQVGSATGGCSNHGVVYSYSGQRTNYFTSEHIGYCANDGWGPVLEPV